MAAPGGGGRAVRPVRSLAWWDSRTGVMTALGTFVSALALIVTVVAVVSQDDPPPPAAAGPAGPAAAPVARTPWLGVEVWQDDRRVPLSVVGDRTDGPVRAVVSRAPFELRFPRLRADVDLGVCTWTDDSVFYLREDGSIEDVPCLAAGTGIADTEAGSGDLFVADDGHSAFGGGRVRHLDADTDAVFVSRIVGGDAPLGPGRYYLTMLVDADGDRKVSRPEFDYLILDYGL